MADALPIEEVLPDVVRAANETGCVVLQAPPGAGKTSRVPLALLPHVKGKIIMLEPRRIAARAAAERLADQLGERPGGQVGFRMRGETVPGSRIEVVTEGILTRMVQSDPSLPDVGAVIFDEFHERSLQADLGLALVWEARQALRDDLILVVMSATLDAAPVAHMLDDAPIVTSQGRSFPVDVRWMPKPVGRAKLVPGVADLVCHAASETEGGILVFLPGAREISQTEALLNDRLSADCVVQPLYGALPFAAQRAAIAPLNTGRKVVLATSIAETSLTIEDIRVVVDAGRARRSRFDPGTGMQSLVTEPVSRAEATQRTGRAGRVAPGVCYRYWAKAEEGALPAFAPPEILTGDLAGLALDLANWGAQPADLAFLTPPPDAAMAEAEGLLTDLGALRAGRITEHGRKLARLPLHPRLAHMLVTAGRQAAPTAAVLSERGATRRDVDLARVLRDTRSLTRDIKRLGRLVEPRPDLSVGQMAALAYPDRIGLRRKGDAARYVLSGGRGAQMDDAASLAGERLIVACDLDGQGRDARIRLAAALTEPELRDIFAGQIRWSDRCVWSKRDGRVLMQRQEKLGTLVLDQRNWPDAPPEAVGAAMLDGIRQLGLSLGGAAARFRARAIRLADLPDMSDAALLARLEDWLLPYLKGITTTQAWRNFDVLPALRGILSWDEQQRLDREVPAHFTTPLGRKIPIDYDAPAPEISLRLQEMFGQTEHPLVAGEPLRVTLLSPGGKPVQTTQDIPGFWATSYADVRRDMRGRYPKHPWPEDPSVADPTLRAKPRNR